MKKYVFLLTVLSVAVSAHARKLEPKANANQNLSTERTLKNTKESKTVKTVVVNGMVCSFCSTSLEKKFKKQKEISNIKVDLEKKKVTLVFMPGETIEDSKIKKMVKSAGYDVVSVSGAKRISKLEEEM